MRKGATYNSKPFTLFCCCFQRPLTLLRWIYKEKCFYEFFFLLPPSHSSLHSEKNACFLCGSFKPCGKLIMNVKMSSASIRLRNEWEFLSSKWITFFFTDFDDQFHKFLASTSICSLNVTLIKKELKNKKSIFSIQREKRESRNQINTIWTINKI